MFFLCKNGAGQCDLFGFTDSVWMTLLRLVKCGTVFLMDLRDFGLFPPPRTSSAIAVYVWGIDRLYEAVPFFINPHTNQCQIKNYS